MNHPSWSWRNNMLLLPNWYNSCGGKLALFKLKHCPAHARIGLENSGRFYSKTNGDKLTHFFPRFVSATCSYFEFWLVHWIVCDWLQWLLWFCSVLFQLEMVHIRRQTRSRDIKLKLTSKANRKENLIMVQLDPTNSNSVISNSQPFSSDLPLSH